jgi:hypothetical protein
MHPWEVTGVHGSYSFLIISNYMTPIRLMVNFPFMKTYILKSILIYSVYAKAQTKPSLDRRQGEILTAKMERAWT